MLERFERFSIAISEVSKYWHKLAADEMEKHGLRGIHSVYLLTLDRHSNGMTAAELCEHCGRDKADVSRMMAMMEKKGMVLKESVHNNLYRGVFRLTEKGKEAAHQVQLQAIRAVEFAGKDLSKETRQIFYDSLESIVTNLRELNQKGIPTK